ncbi:hypothetical protein ABBQ38_011394 [Trebouxia sp. C0009 RCD-2024]
MRMIVFTIKAIAKQRDWLCRNNYRSSAVSDSELKLLVSKYPSLRSLEFTAFLSPNLITVSCMADLSRMTEIRKLHAGARNFEMVEAIHKFTHIEQLHLDYDMYFHRSLAVPELPCSSFPNLVHLTIDSADWDEPPNSYAYLSQLHSLRHLELCSGVPPAPQCLAGFTQLTGLELHGFNSDNIQEVQHLPTLCSLRMCGKPTSVEIGILACMIQLTYLHVDNMEGFADRHVRCQLSAVLDLCSLTNLAFLSLEVAIDGYVYEAGLDSDSWESADLIISTPASPLAIPLNSKRRLHS